MKAPLYVHIPYCLKKCGYCDFFSIPQKSVPNDYVEALAQQIEFLAKNFFVEEWKSVYIGGGSPSLLAPESLAFLCKKIKDAAPLSDGGEWTVEMNPGSLSKELLEAAKAGGANRLSVGIQCKNDLVLKTAGRLATEKEILEAAALIKKSWGLSWSADLMAGLPFQTKEILEDDIDFVSSAGANHVSLYSLTLEEGTPLKEKIDFGKIPYDEEKAEELWLFGRDELERRGFFQYEVSNFSKPGFESRHNAFYWALESYLGAGAGAAGTIYKNPEGVRYTNILDAAAYTNFWLNKGGAAINNGKKNGNAPLDFPCQKEALDMETQEFEYLMMNLRTRRGASKKEYQKRFGRSLARRLEKAGKSDWLLRRSENGEDFFSMTREGLLFLNSFLEEL